MFKKKNQNPQDPCSPDASLWAKFHDMSWLREHRGVLAIWLAGDLIADIVGAAIALIIGSFIAMQLGSLIHNASLILAAMEMA